MFCIFFLPVSVFIGFLAGGRLSNLGRLDLRWLPLVFAALVVQLLIFPLVTSAPLIPFATQPLHILSYVLLAVWIVANVRILPIALAGIGALCNFLVILANNGLMPSSIHALQSAGLLERAAQLAENGTYANLVRMSAQTHLNFLGDILYLPRWIPFSVAFSIGDLSIMLALGWLIVKGMRTHDEQPRESSPSR
jgi:hypothetical protein